MTHRLNAMTHTQEYRVLPGVVRHTFVIFGLFTTPNLCPPDTKSWRRHCIPSSTSVRKAGSYRRLRKRSTVITATSVSCG